MTDVRVVSEPTTYSRENPDTSFFADLFRWSKDKDQRSGDRLVRGTKETLTLAEERGVTFRDAEGRAMSSSTGAGGDFLPPIYFGELYAEFKRAKRVTSALVWNRVLPPMGTTITVPRVTGGATTAAQTADNASTSNTDETTGLLTIPVCTVAGYVDVSRQILERSEPGMDEIIAQDLIGSYGKQVNTYVVNGSGASGQPKGILQTSFNSILFTTGSPTVGLVYPKLVDANRQVNEAIFEPVTAFVMTARRWAWFLDALDSNQRPLVVPDMVTPYADMITYELDSGKSGPFFNESAHLLPVGSLLGVPVFVDETLPKTQGAGTNQDVILSGCFKKHILWEDQNGPRQFQFNDLSLAQSAAVRLQCFGSIAFTAERFATASSVISGTGLVAPTF